MKLDNQNFWLTGDEIDFGECLYTLDILNIYDHMQSTVYYKSGIPEIDTLFGEKGVIKQGYITTITSYENCISIYFLKYFRDQVEELAIAHIRRDRIVKFEETVNQSLTVVKREEAKHKAKYMFKNGAGLIGSITGMVGE